MKAKHGWCIQSFSLSYIWSDSVLLQVYLEDKMVLTVGELRQIITFLGWSVSNDTDDDDDLELVIQDGHQEGILDEGERIFSKHMVQFADMPEEGWYPIGEQL